VKCAKVVAAWLAVALLSLAALTACGGVLEVGVQTTATTNAPATPTIAALATENAAWAPQVGVSTIPTPTPVFALGSAKEGKLTNPIPPTPTPAPCGEPVKPSYPISLSEEEIAEICASIDLAPGVSAPAALLPPPDMEYVPLPAGTTEVDAPGLVAYLADPPAHLTESMGLFAPPRRPWMCPNARAYAILACVRYQGDGHTVVVSTVEFSPAAEEAYARGEVMLEGEPITLADGTPAWFSETEPDECWDSPPPNQVAWQEGDLFICVASDLPRKDVEALATQVVLNLGSPE